MCFGYHVLALFLIVQLSTVSCDTFYIVTLSSSPCPGEYIGVPCLTLQQYASNPSQSQNITFLVEPGIYNLSTVLTVSDGYNFTMSSTNATVTCTSATAQFEFNTVENVHISGITFQGCRNTAIRMLQVTSASIVSSNFINNQAVSGSSRYGGCLYITSSSISISESEFHNNRAYYSGGAIYASSSTVRIDGSQFSFNTQVYYWGYGGGAISAQYSNITVDSSVFDNNSGRYGGVIYISYINSGNFQIFNTTFLNNRARRGGAIHATQVLTNSSVSQCQFINNIASENGGAVYMHTNDITTVTITVTIAQCQFRNNSAIGQGGALYMYVRTSYRTNNNILSAITITQCQIVNNTATSNGGGIYIYYLSYNIITITTTVTKSQLVNNKASRNGGAIYMEKVMTGSTTIGNTSLTHCQFVNNTAGGNGGAVYKTGSNVSTIVVNNYYSSNIANAFGGSLYISGTNSSVSVTGSTFINNTAITEGGGAIYSNGQYANVTLTSSTFHNNSASYCSVLDVDNYNHFSV